MTRTSTAQRPTRHPAGTVAAPPLVPGSLGTVPSPIGPLLLAATADGLCGIHFDRDGGWGDLAARFPEVHWRADQQGLAPYREALDAYFAGGLRIFDLPLAPRGTAFELAVWRGLRAIPWGRTISYGELAAAVGRPGAARAVGAACGRNPLAIVVPCHRVVGSGGALTGYGGGLERKAFLLRLESGHARRDELRRP